MAQISIDIPDAQLARVRDALCAQNGYQDTVNGQPNPVTKNQFAKKVVADFVKASVRSYEASQAAQTVTEVNVT